MKCQRCGRFGTEANPMYQLACADPWWKGGGAHFNVQVCEECGGNAVLEAAMAEHEKVCPERLVTTTFRMVGDWPSPKGYSPVRRWLRQERARRGPVERLLADHYAAMICGAQAVFGGKVQMIGGFERIAPWQDITEGDETVFYSAAVRWPKSLLDPCIPGLREETDEELRSRLKRGDGQCRRMLIPE